MTPGLSSSPQLDEGTPPEPKGTFVDYQTTVVKYSKAIAVTAQEMVRKGDALPIVCCPSVPPPSESSDGSVLEQVANQ